MAQYAETTATARRRRRPPPAAVALAAVGALGAAAVLTGVVELPDFADALEGLTASLGAWTYLLVPALAFLETGAFVGLLVPGETAVLVGGVVAERGGVALVPLIGLVWLGACGGDAVSFLIGRRLGRPFLERHGRRLGIGEAQLLSAERFFSRFGGRAVLFARFVGVLRALTPFVAGASSYPLRRFVPFSVAGTFVWATTFSLIGFLFSETFAATGSTVTHVLIAVAVTGAVLLLRVADVAKVRCRLHDRPHAGAHHGVVVEDGDAQRRHAAGPVGVHRPVGTSEPTGPAQRRAHRGGRARRRGRHGRQGREPAGPAEIGPASPGIEAADVTQHPGGLAWAAGRRSAPRVVLLALVAGDSRRFAPDRDTARVPA